MGIKEKQIINKRLINLNDNERLFRINAGSGWVGKVVKRTQDAIIIKNPQPLIAAPKGWPDLCGFTEIEITEDMVGEKIAVFTGEEVKATGTLSKEQKIFRDIILKMGGYFRVLKE